MKQCICFIFNKGYVQQGKHSILSAKLHNPNHTTILLTDDSSLSTLADIVLTPKEIGISINNWLTIGRIAIVEYALTILDFDTAILVDGDTYTYNNYEDLQNVLDNHSIVVIPHITKPFPNDNHLPAHNTLALAGNYNAGVWAASKTGLSFIEWWKKQTSLFPIMNPGAGFFNEQGWLRFVCDFDDNAKIFKHPGYNVAYWNIKQRNIEYKDNTFFIDGSKLSIMHFSGLNKEIHPSHMSIFQNRYVLDPNDIEYKLYNEYHQLIWGSL